jgi:hypothetical protein
MDITDVQHTAAAIAPFNSPFQQIRLLGRALQIKILHLLRSRKIKFQLLMRKVISHLIQVH